MPAFSLSFSYFLSSGLEQYLFILLCTIFTQFQNKVHMIHWAHNRVGRALVTPLITRRSFHVPFYNEYRANTGHQTVYLVSLCVYV